MSGSTNTAPPRAVEGNNHTLRRRKRAPVVGFYIEPKQREWNPSDARWEEIEEAYIFELSGEVRGALCDIVSNYFYSREIELTLIDRAEAQAYLAQVSEAAATLNILLTANPASPTITATRDALRYVLFDPTSPSLKAYIERSGEPAHEAVFSFDSLDDILFHLGRIIEATHKAADGPEPKERPPA